MPKLRHLLAAATLSATALLAAGGTASAAPACHDCSTAEPGGPALEHTHSATGGSGLADGLRLGVPAAAVGGIVLARRRRAGGAPVAV